VGKFFLILKIASTLWAIVLLVHNCYLLISIVLTSHCALSITNFVAHGTDVATKETESGGHMAPNWGGYDHYTSIARWGNQAYGFGIIDHQMESNLWHVATIEPRAVG